MLILSGVSLVSNLRTNDNYIVCKNNSSIFLFETWSGNILVRSSLAMIKVVAKSGNLANLLRSTSAVGATTQVPIVPAVPEELQPIYPGSPSRATAYSAACNLPVKKLKVISGPTGKSKFISCKYSPTADIVLIKTLKAKHYSIMKHGSNVFAIPYTLGKKILYV